MNVIAKRNLLKDFSNPSGAVLVSTPYIGYTYDVTNSGDLFTKRLRLSTMKYPSDKTLTYWDVIRLKHYGFDIGLRKIMGLGIDRCEAMR